MGKLISKIRNRFKVIMSFILNVIAYLSLVFAFLVYRYEVNENTLIPEMKSTLLAIMFACIVICITRLLLKRYIQFAIISFVTLLYSIKAIPLVEKIISNDYYYRYDAIQLTIFRGDLTSFENFNMRFTVLIILAVEIFYLIKNISHHYKLLNITPQNMTNHHNNFSHNTSTNNYYQNNFDDDYYYNHGSYDHNKKFYSQSSSEYVGKDSYGRDVYKEYSTGKYTTVETYSHNIVEESYNRPYDLDDYDYSYNNDSYYNDSYYNNDSYVEHNYGFDNYDNYSDYYSDGLNSYLDDDY